MKKITTTALLSTVFLTLPVMADHMEEVRVIGQKDKMVLDTSNLTVAVPDTAELLKRVPGANINKNGPLAGVPQYRGMFADRINVQINDMAVQSGGPNWMDAPLHYAPAALLEKLTVYRGIAPVSEGQETIGGVVKADTWSGYFAEDANWDNHGRFYTGVQNNGDGWVSALSTAFANKNHKLFASGLTEQGNDWQAGNDAEIPSEYERNRYELGYAYQNNGHRIEVKGSRNLTDDASNPSLGMDTAYIDGDHSQVRYSFENDEWETEVKLTHGEVEHLMTNYHLRKAPAANAMWRKNLATVKQDGFLLSLKRKTATMQWEIGVDGDQSEHNSFVTNPHNPAFYVNNFANAERQLFGIFSEATIAATDIITVDLGLRYNRATTDSDKVNSSMAMMMPAVVALRNRFNNADLKQEDDLIDAVAKISAQIEEDVTLYAGVARKSRAPSYQERYLWLPMQATAGLADGNNHVGNVELKPEISHEIELGVDWKGSYFQVSPRLFWKEIDGYIQGTPATDMPVVMVSTMMGDTTPLQYNNVNARIYGADLEYLWEINNHWSVGGVLSAVRGERKDIDDELYRLSPYNMTAAINYRSNNWLVSVQSVLYAQQKKVSKTNEEERTAGYGLLNASVQYDMGNGLTLVTGIDNALDKKYEDHLAGYNRAFNPDIATGDRLLGMGRTLYARAKWQW